MTDIVQRLRVKIDPARTYYEGHEDLLRNEAADTIEALHARVTELEKLAEDNTTLYMVLADIRQQTGVGVRLMLSELAQAVGDRIRALEEALRPFGNQAKKWNSPAFDDDDIFEGVRGITYGDFRRARSLLEGRN